MFNNTRIRLMAVVLMVALLTLTLGGIASAKDLPRKQLIKTDIKVSGQKLAKIRPFERHLSAYLPRVRAFQPKPKAYFQRLSAFEAYELRWNEPLVTIDPVRRPTRQLFFGPDGGDLGSPLWKHLRRELHIRPDSGL